LSFHEFSIWENKADVKSKMFTPDGFVRPLNFSYFDIPCVNDRSTKSNEIFKVLSETENLAIFNHVSVNIIIEKAWEEHRLSFTFLFLVPYCLLLGTFFFWSNFCSFYHYERVGFSSEAQQVRAGIVSFAIIGATCFYFLMQELYQLGSNPKLYFKSSWNLFDLLAILLCLVSPIHYIINIHHCSHDSADCAEFDTCICTDGIPCKSHYCV
jgi:hypothetical protein